MRAILTIPAFFICLHVCAQSLRTPVSSAYEMLNAYSPDNSDAFSFTFNTAALARQNGFAAGAFAENRFSVKELNHYSSVVGLETQQGNFGFQADYFGYALFSEYQLGLAYARSLGADFDIGAQFNYYSYRIPSYGQHAAVTFQIGVIGRVSDVLNVGLQVYNPAGGYLSERNEEKLPANYRFGVGYEPEKNVIVSATIEKEEGRIVDFTGGVFYQFDGRFFVRAGVRTGEATPFAAAGIFFDDMRIDLSVSHHPQLGFSPGVMIIYQPKRNQP